MPAAPEQVRFVVDENLLRLGRAIAQLRNDIALVGQEPVADLLPVGDSRLRLDPRPRFSWLGDDH